MDPSQQLATIVFLIEGFKAAAYICIASLALLVSLVELWEGVVAAIEANRGARPNRYGTISSLSMMKSGISGPLHLHGLGCFSFWYERSLFGVHNMQVAHYIFVHLSTESIHQPGVHSVSTLLVFFFLAMIADPYHSIQLYGVTSDMPSAMVRTFKTYDSSILIIFFLADVCCFTNTSVLALTLIKVSIGICVCPLWKLHHHHICSQYVELFPIFNPFMVRLTPLHSRPFDESARLV